MRRIRAIGAGVGALAVLALTLSGVAARPSGYVSGKAEIIDGQHLTIGGKTVSLYGIEAPALDAECYEWHGTRQIPYDCGQHAKAFLASIAVARDFVCVTAAGGDNGQVTCYADGRDVAEAMVQAGWAVACGYASRYVQQASAARTARVGLWAGNFDGVGQCSPDK